MPGLISCIRKFASNRVCPSVLAPREGVEEHWTAGRQARWCDYAGRHLDRSRQQGKARVDDLGLNRGVERIELALSDLGQLTAPAASRPP